MDQYIDLSKMLGGFFDDGRDLIVPGHVTFLDPLAADLLCQRPDAALKHFAGVADADVCTLSVECLRNSPCDGTFICQTKNQCVLVFQ